MYVLIPCAKEYLYLRHSVAHPNQKRYNARDTRHTRYRQVNPPAPLQKLRVLCAAWLYLAAGVVVFYYLLLLLL